MLGCRDVDKLEVEQENRGDPAIDHVIWVQSRVVDHAFDELGVHLDNELLDSDCKELHLPESAKESAEFQLSLRVASFAIVKGDGTKTTGVALPVFAQLEENESDAVHTGGRGGGTQGVN